MEDKHKAEVHNEEAKKELMAKDELNQKRLQAKLNRDKHPDVKLLIAQEETAVEHNAEMSAKLNEELKKFDKLYDETLEYKEKLGHSESLLNEILNKIDD